MTAQHTMFLFLQIGKEEEAGGVEGGRGGGSFGIGVMFGGVGVGDEDEGEAEEK